MRLLYNRLGFYGISKRFPPSITALSSNITLVILQTHGCRQQATRPLLSPHSGSHPHRYGNFCASLIPLVAQTHRSFPTLLLPISRQSPSTRWPVKRLCYSCRASPFTQLHYVAAFPSALSRHCREQATWFLVQLGWTTLLRRMTHLEKLSRALKRFAIDWRSLYHINFMSDCNDIKYDYLQRSYKFLNSSIYNIIFKYLCEFTSSFIPFIFNGLSRNSEKRFQAMNGDLIGAAA